MSESKMPVKRLINQNNNSGELHNHNCFLYLKELQLSLGVIELIRDRNPRIARHLDMLPFLHYMPSRRFADFYSDLLEFLEQNGQALLNKAADKPQLSAELKQLFLSLYANKSSILQATYAQIEDTLLKHSLISNSVETEINKQFTKQDTDNLLSIAPTEAGSQLGRFRALVSDDFKPQQSTSLSSIRTYNHHKESDPIEYRMGTAAQRHAGHARLSPLFGYFLQAKESKTHLYINNLARNRDDYEGSKEVALSKKLEMAEKQYPNLYVITLPADKGLMHHNAYKETEKHYTSAAIQEEFLKIATDSSDLKIKDFYISPEVRKILFANQSEESKLNQLIHKSFEALGLNHQAKLSGAEKQAVYFHFIKYELTAFIIDTLKPSSLNFSCKDGIDRGGVSSAYYNLMQSLERNQPMSQPEFLQALHAAPAMVKGRGMNDHIHLIWNAIDLYVNKNVEDLRNNASQRWMIEWRDLNCPHENVAKLLDMRIKQLNNIDTGDKANLGNQIIQHISAQQSKDVSGKRLLLQALTQTEQLMLDTKPSRVAIKTYETTIEKLTINFPTLTILAGYLRAFLGLLLSVVSDKELSKGRAIVNAGMESDTRTLLTNGMFNFKEELGKLKKQADEPASESKVQP